MNLPNPLNARAGIGSCGTIGGARIGADAGAGPIDQTGLEHMKSQVSDALERLNTIASDLVTYSNELHGRNGNDLQDLVVDDSDFGRNCEKVCVPVGDLSLASRINKLIDTVANVERACRLLNR